MKFKIVAFLAILIILVCVDLLSFLIFKKEVKQTSITKNLARLFFGIVPLVFGIAYFYLTIQIREISSPDFYHYFMVINGAFLLLYMPKIFYLLYYGLFMLIDWAFSHYKVKKASLEQTTIRYPRISRKKFVSQVGIIFATAPFISVLFGMVKGRFSFFTKHQKIKYPNLPSNFSGFKIIHISDIHLGSFASNYHKLEGIVDIINKENADVIFFTGDLVNNFAEETHGWESMFQQLKAKSGKFSVLGNHDYGDYSNWPSEAAKQENFQGILDAHKKFGFRLLKDESVALSIGDQEIAITGVENWGQAPFPQYGDLQQAKKGTEHFDFKILLSHDPDHWEAEVVGQTSYDLTLAGHTHGMQFGINWKGFKWSPAKYKFKHWDGLYKNKDQYLYVNRGLGYLGMPARIGMAPEITVIELNS